MYCPVSAVHGWVDYHCHYCHRISARHKSLISSQGWVCSTPSLWRGPPEKDGAGAGARNGLAAAFVFNFNSFSPQSGTFGINLRATLRGHMQPTGVCAVIFLGGIPFSLGSFSLRPLFSPSYHVCSCLSIWFFYLLHLCLSSHLYHPFLSFSMSHCLSFSLVSVPSSCYPWPSLQPLPLSCYCCTLCTRAWHGPFLPPSQLRFAGFSMHCPCPHSLLPKHPGPSYPWHWLIPDARGQALASLTLFHLPKKFRRSTAL